MINRSERFAEAAKSLVGTPFVNHGRDPSVGLDCAGLVIAALRMIGMDPDDGAEYALVPHADLAELVKKQLETAFDLCDGELEAGDVLLMRWRPMGMYNHIGIYIGKAKMVHAWDSGPARGVRITPMDHSVAKKIASQWRLK
jgi:cell wall-associated NlpC family hydrolase